MAYIIYLVLCGLNGVMLSTANISPADWQFWVSILCVVGAWLCGKEDDNKS